VQIKVPGGHADPFSSLPAPSILVEFLNLKQVLKILSFFWFLDSSLALDNYLNSRENLIRL